MIATNFMYYVFVIVYFTPFYESNLYEGLKGILLLLPRKILQFTIDSYRAKPLELNVSGL